MHILCTSAALIVVSAPAAEAAPIRPELADGYGCQPASVYIDEASAPSAERIAIVHDALANFAYATGWDWPEVTSPDGARIVIRWTTRVSAGEAYAWATLDHAATGIVLSSEPYHTDEGIARHELGHLVGLEHDQRTGSVMGREPSQNRYGVIDLVRLRWLGIYRTKLCDYR